MYRYEKAMYCYEHSMMQKSSWKRQFPAYFLQSFSLIEVKMRLILVTLKWADIGNSETGQNTKIFA